MLPRPRIRRYHPVLTTQQHSCRLQILLQNHTNVPGHNLLDKQVFCTQQPLKACQCHIRSRAILKSQTYCIFAYCIMPRKGHGSHHTRIMLLLLKMQVLIAGIMITRSILFFHTQDFGSKERAPRLVWHNFGLYSACRTCRRGCGLSLQHSLRCYWRATSAHEREFPELVLVLPPAYCQKVLKYIVEQYYRLKQIQQSTVGKIETVFHEALAGRHIIWLVVTLVGLLVSEPIVRYPCTWLQPRSTIKLDSYFIHSLHLVRLCLEP